MRKQKTAGRTGEEPPAGSRAGSGKAITFVMGGGGAVDLCVAVRGLEATVRGEAWGRGGGL